jgi:hypothetical protein
MEETMTTHYALAESDLRRYAPSIFATQAHEDRSDRFVPIATIDIVRRLQKEGFEPHVAMQCKTRDASRREFCKHIIRFRHASTDRFVAGVTPEVVLINANDGGSAYKLMAGMFRFICENGMIVQNGRIDDVRIRHQGDAVGEVIEGSFRVLDSVVKQMETPEEWSRIQLNRDSQLALADGARTIRFGDAEGNVDTPIQARQLLMPRRVADAGNDLWTTFNRVQENCIRGGLSAWSRDVSTGRSRRTTTRGVNSIDGDIKLNKALWTLGERMARIMNNQAAYLALKGC